MPIISLPDGSERHYASNPTVDQVAADIGSGLHRAAIAGEFAGNLLDTSREIQSDGRLRIITGRDDEGLQIIRHSTAHLLAQAVKRLYPSAQVTIGPVIEDGFYYDFAFERGFTNEDLEKIENCMREIAAEKLLMNRKVIGRDDAVSLFRDMGEEYKAQIIHDLPENEQITLYEQGDFVDLCRGPHVPDTSFLKAFKLTKVAGAYWRGDSSNEMLQRIYGTAFSSKSDLDTYLKQQQEAMLRDHRKLGAELDLFHFQEEAPGMAFWHEKGWTLFRLVESYMRDLLKDYNYTEVHTPQLIDRSLWERSGHWETFQENMFTTEIENKSYALKPMNCPGHVQVFNQGLRSFRDLPLRISEFGIVHRYEPSGTLHGLMRVRRFTQDDAHVFCTEEQIQTEVETLIEIALRVYSDFGFNEISIGLSTRPEKRVGSDELWNSAENALQAVLEQRGMDYTMYPGEGAFYGPKIDFVLNDSMGRKWQCGTIQLDFSMPGRLGAQYVDSDSTKRTPVMIHRAILGSVERFIGILIEEHAGKFPVWLAPVQAVVMNISEAQKEYSFKISDSLKKAGIRVALDLRNEKIGFKIREQTLNKVPYLLVIGNREVENEQIAVRALSGEDFGPQSIASVIKMIHEASNLN
ncbi:MAG: threonine--tRNA ligase [Acidiferrobacterales bacterium]|nr:threonine--tRNA ligase [Acidiferrobacterales bacterium]